MNLPKKNDVNAEEKIQRVHRRRKLPIKMYDNPDTAAEFTLSTFYCKEMNLVLDKMNNVLTSKCDNINSSFKDLYDVLDPNIEE